MYNRYIPGTNGIYQRHTVPDQPKIVSTEAPKLEISHPCETERAQQQPVHRQPGPLNLDWGDLLLVCIVLLLLIDSEEDDMLPILIMAAAFVLLQ